MTSLQRPKSQPAKRPSRAAVRPARVRTRPPSAARGHPGGGAGGVLASGFAAARLDDVARRAGVAKGTIYLYFRDKEALFQELVRSMLIRWCHHRSAPQAIFRTRAIARIAELFVREIYGTRRKDVLRLVIAEGARFPELAEFYYRGGRTHPAVMRALLHGGRARRSSTDALARFPQLLVAPALMAIVWNGMFERFAPLDVHALMPAHLDILFGERNAHEPIVPSLRLTGAALGWPAADRRSRPTRAGSRPT